MTEQDKLREEIAKTVANSRCEVCDNCGASIGTDNPDEVADQILAIIKAVWRKTGLEVKDGS